MVKWGELIHAYGPADDVPEQLRNVASADESVREKAIWSLYGNIFHQGTRYQASPHAVPFLLGLLEKDVQPEKAQLISLLLYLALGYEEAFLPGPFKPEYYRQQLREESAQLTDKDREESARYGYSPDYLIEVYDAVRDGAHLFIPFLQNADENLRDISAYALAWFPEIAASSLPALKNALDTESQASCAATMRISLGVLGKASDRLSEVETHLAADLQSDDFLTVSSAAIALSPRPPSEALMPKILACLSDSKTLNGLYSGAVNDGDLASLAGEFCRGIEEPELRKELIRALSDTLAHANALSSLDITSLILRNLSDWYGPFHERDMAPLSELEQMGLMAIVNHGAWTMGETGIFANYSQLIKRFKLPTKREELLLWIQSPDIRVKSKTQETAPANPPPVKSPAAPQKGLFSGLKNLFKK